MIYERIRSLGVELSGKNPANNLSALLHHSELFESHGRTGWALSAVGADLAAQEEREGLEEADRATRAKLAEEDSENENLDDNGDGDEEDVDQQIRSII